MPESGLPLPPVELARRVGVPDNDDVIDSYLQLGADARQVVLNTLPDDWSPDGRRVLDFGAGAGKVLRHLLEDWREAELHGCDIDAPSIEWLQANLSPPIHAFVNGETPPLDRPDGHFHLVLAMSVFTHLTDHSFAWLAELHRVMAEGGLLIASFLGQQAYGAYGSGGWDEDRIGMNVMHYGQSWDLGGPTVFHSPWWLREHWGRAFEIVSLRDGRARGDHGIVLLRRRPGTVAARDLELPSDDPREIEALRFQVRQLLDETGELRREAGDHSHNGLRARLGGLRRRVSR
ncbi:MAG: class I SAM-dependent methyltransferase [Actinomycetota bacterium]|nr:class I SAM-dependent methyltransferase [Actinomycetota bacterium]MDQ3720124.1 class I SAM-dependent methyltransferase [Actinomycetota bacterium]